MTSTAEPGREPVPETPTHAVVEQIPFPASVSPDAADAPAAADYVAAVDLENAVRRAAIGSDELSWEPDEQLPHLLDEVHSDHRLFGVREQGRLVAVTPTSVTALGADGVARTYVVDSNTNAITVAGSQVGNTAGTFAVNDEVAIVGEVRDGTAVATAVAHRDVSALNGPPMDAATP